jgi:hypothetical protein
VNSALLLDGQAPQSRGRNVSSLDRIVATSFFFLHLDHHCLFPLPLAVVAY